MRTRLLVPSGMPDHVRGGDTSWPSQVYFAGIGEPSRNAGEFRRSVMVSSAASGEAIRAIPRHRVIDALVVWFALGNRDRCIGAGGPVELMHPDGPRQHRS